MIAGGHAGDAGTHFRRLSHRILPGLVSERIGRLTTSDADLADLASTLTISFLQGSRVTWLASRLDVEQPGMIASGLLPCHGHYVADNKGTCDQSSFHISHTTAVGRMSLFGLPSRD